MLEKELLLLSFYSAEGVDVCVLEGRLRRARRLEDGRVRNVPHVRDALDVGDGRDGRIFPKDRLVLRRPFMFEYFPFKRLNEALLVPKILHLTELEDADVLAEQFDIRYYVRREDDRSVLRYAREQVKKVYPLLGIESRRRLVDDKRLRVADYRLRDTGAAEHSAGVFPELFFLFSDKADGLDGGSDQLFSFRLILHPSHNADIVEEFDDIEAGHQFCRLGQIAERFAEVVFALLEVDAVDEDRAVGLIHNSGDDAHQRRLPRSVAPDESEYPVRYGDIHPVKRFLLPARINFCEICNFNHRGFLS